MTWQPYTAAVALAGAAAWFSIRGMTVLFPGAPVAVIVMSASMEAAKLVTVGWLARRWRLTAWIWRVTLVALVSGLAVINTAGVYAQLVAAHLGERGAAQASIEMQDAALAARIEIAVRAVADVDRRIGQIDTTIEEAAKRGRNKSSARARSVPRSAVVPTARIVAGVVPDVFILALSWIAIALLRRICAGKCWSRLIKAILQAGPGAWARTAPCGCSVPPNGLRPCRAA